MKKTCFYLLCWLLPCCLPAQAAQPPVVHRAVSQQQWEKASGNLDYSRDVPKAEKPKKKQMPDNPGTGNPARNWNLNTEGLGVFLQVLAVVLAAALIAFGIYRMIGQPRNRRIARDGAVITLDNLDEYLHETELDTFLREALAQGNYAQAVRLYFLQAIKNLSAAGAIHWSKEKTNRDYLRELRDHRLGPDMRHITRTYEEIWYGNVSLTASQFERLEPSFKKLLADI